MKKFSILLACCLLCGFGTQSATKSKNAHARAHQEQLAAARNTGLDKATLNRLVEKDILQRELDNGLDPETSQLLDDIIEEARTHIGKRYVWATHGPNTFDCSGFTSYVYKQFGYNISPGSKMQYTQGEVVPRSDIRKGDLIFFRGRNNKGGVGHVGIIVDVDDNGHYSFIHANVKRGITITSGDEAYYVKRFVGFKRIVK